MTAEILWNSSMILRLNGRQGQGQGKRSLEARADAFSRLKRGQIKERVLYTTNWVSSLSLLHYFFI